jgi:hypothetical protein
MPGQGVASCFTFGQGFGAILGVLAAYQVATVLVAPQAWQSSILGPVAPGGCKADRRKAGKARACAWAREHWPGVELRARVRCKVDHDGLADALCIATWGSRAYAFLG